MGWLSERKARKARARERERHHLLRTLANGGAVIGGWSTIELLWGKQAADEARREYKTFTKNRRDWIKGK